MRPAPPTAIAPRPATTARIWGLEPVVEESVKQRLSQYRLQSTSSSEVSAFIVVFHQGILFAYHFTQSKVRRSSRGSPAEGRGVGRRAHCRRDDSSLSPQVAGSDTDSRGQEARAGIRHLGPSWLAQEFQHFVISFGRVPVGAALGWPGWIRSD